MSRILDGGNGVSWWMGLMPERLPTDRERFDRYIDEMIEQYYKHARAKTDAEKIYRQENFKHYI